MGGAGHNSGRDHRHHSGSLIFHQTETPGLISSGVFLLSKIRSNAKIRLMRIMLMTANSVNKKANLIGLKNEI